MRTTRVGSAVMATFWRGTNAAGLATATRLAALFGYSPVVNG